MHRGVRCFPKIGQVWSLLIYWRRCMSKRRNCLRHLRQRLSWQLYPKKKPWQNMVQSMGFIRRPSTTGSGSWRRPHLLYSQVIAEALRTNTKRKSQPSTPKLASLPWNVFFYRGLKENMSVSVRAKLVSKNHRRISLVRPCCLHDQNLSRLYYKKAGVSANNLKLMKII